MNQARRRSILEAACRDPGLMAQIPPVVAAGFGVLPLRRLGDVLTVACFPQSNRSALRLLRDVCDAEIVATPFEERLLHEAIRRAYFPGDERVNFPTFRDPEFLDDPGSAAALGREKVEEPGPCHQELAEDAIALGSLTYRSSLWNIDAPRAGGALPNPSRVRLELGSLDAGWRRVDGHVHLHLPEGGDLDPGAALVLTQYRLSEYRHLQRVRVSEHHVEVAAVSSLPLMVHPTEVQLVGIDPDGALTFHVYDHLERFAPGEPARVELDYHFLSYGSRMRREMVIELHELERVPRRELQVAEREVPWSPRELGRWFGLPQGVQQD